MTTIPSTTYLTPVGEADVPRMSSMNAIFDKDSLNWTLPDEVFQKTRTFLDVGCGNGELTIKFAQKLGEEARIVAVDCSEEQIQIARENSKKLGVTNITWIVKDVYRIDELHNEYKQGFDTVHCRFLLSHLRKPKDAVKLMAALVSSQGTLVMEELSGNRFEFVPAEPYSMKIWRGLISIVHLIQGSNLSTGGTLAKIVNDLGMQNISVSKPNPVAETEEQKSTFSLSMSGFKKYLPSLFHFLINPWIDALTQSQKDPEYSVRFIDFIQVKALK